MTVLSLKWKNKTETEVIPNFLFSVIYHSWFNKKDITSESGSSMHSRDALLVVFFVQGKGMERSNL